MRVLFIALCLFGASAFASEDRMRQEQLIARKYPLVAVYASSVREMVDFWNGLEEKRAMVGKYRGLKRFWYGKDDGVQLYLDRSFYRMGSSVERRLEPLYWDRIVGKEAGELYPLWRKAKKRPCPAFCQKCRAILSDFAKELTLAEQMGSNVDLYWADLALLAEQEEWLAEHEVVRDRRRYTLDHWMEHDKQVPPPPLVLSGGRHPKAVLADSLLLGQRPTTKGAMERLLDHKMRLVEAYATDLEGMIDFWHHWHQVAHRDRRQQNSVIFGFIRLHDKTEEHLKRVCWDPVVGGQAGQILDQWQEMAKGHPSRAMDLFRDAMLDMMSELLQAEQFGCDVASYGESIALLAAKEQWLAQHKINRSDEKRFIAPNWQRYDQTIAPPPTQCSVDLPGPSGKVSSRELCQIWFDYWKEVMTAWIELQRGGDVKASSAALERRLGELASDPAVGETAQELLEAHKRGESAALFDQLIVDLDEESDQVRTICAIRGLFMSLARSAS